MPLPLPPDTGRPPYLPFEAGPHRLAMGLRSLKPAEWIEIDGRYALEMAEKDRLLAERHGDVVAAAPGSEAAAAEARDMLAAHLPDRFPDLFRRENGLLHGPRGRLWTADDDGLAPLDLAGRWVQEDLCLMQRRDEGWVLTAASLCFPNRWRLADKVGRPMGTIHTPVPEYAKRLETPVDRFFDKLAPDRAVWRLNWTLMTGSALFQPSGHGTVTGEALTVDDMPGALVHRVERQTLRKLPRSGAVLFTIRTYVHPLAVVAADAETAARLAAAIRGLTDDMALYKSVTGFRGPLLEWLDARAGTAPA